MNILTVKLLQSLKNLLLRLTGNYDNYLKKQMHKIFVISTVNIVTTTGTFHIAFLINYMM